MRLSAWTRDILKFDWSDDEQQEIDEGRRSQKVACRGTKSNEWLSGSCCMLRSPRPGSMRMRPLMARIRQVVQSFEDVSPISD
jgi:hypothetical protein